MNAKLLTLKSIGLLLASISVTPIAAAASWPEKPVRIIIPWGPGGSTDIVGRLVGAELGARLKQQVIIDNRSGAGGIVGMQIAAQTPPDGYTLMITSSAYGYLINKSTARVDLVKSFASVALLGFADGGLTVSPQLPVKSVRDLIALAKAKPGQLNYASGGIGGFPHMNTELFKFKAGVDIVHVPAKDGGPASVMAGDTHIYFGSLTTSMSYINSGRLKLLAVSGAKRDPNLPDVPTISETVPGYEAYLWFGMFAPLGTPPGIVARLHAATNDALASPELVKKLDAQGVVPAKISSAEFGKLMESETAKWTEVIKVAGIKGE